MQLPGLEEPANARFARALRLCDEREVHLDAARSARELEEQLSVHNLNDKRARVAWTPHQATDVCRHIREGAAGTQGKRRRRTAEDALETFEKGAQSQPRSGLLPNGSRLSCGRNARRRKAAEPQTKRLAGEATQFFPNSERPAASSAC